MAISGTCCLVIGFLYGGNPLLLLLVAAIWGATVVADSAQFSSCVTELGDPQYIGTALTIQMCIGFLLTTISIELIPKAGECVGLALRVHDPRAGAIVWRDRDAASASATRSRQDRSRPEIRLNHKDTKAQMKYFVSLCLGG